MGYRALRGPSLPEVPCDHPWLLEICIATVDKPWQMGDPPAKKHRKAPTRSHVCRNVLASGEPCCKEFATLKKLLEHRDEKSTLGGITVRKRKQSGCNSRAQIVMALCSNIALPFWPGIVCARR